MIIINRYNLVTRNKTFERLIENKYITSFTDNTTRKSYKGPDVKTVGIAHTCGLMEFIVITPNDDDTVNFRFTTNVVGFGNDYEICAGYARVEDDWEFVDDGHFAYAEFELNDEGEDEHDIYVMESLSYATAQNIIESMLYIGFNKYMCEECGVELDTIPANVTRKTDTAYTVLCDKCYRKRK